MKLLAIGNSFSQDATAYLKQLADSAGVDAKIVNLYIGGCSLQMHAQNIAQDTQSYSYEYSGAPTGRMVSIREALEEDRWDAVTVQQVSGESGIPESYEPYGTQVLDCVKRYAPQAKIWFHKTWANETDSNHGDFPRYGCSQADMYRAICIAAAQFAQRHALPIIPTGDVIQRLRGVPLFAYGNGGVSLCRDGFHMSLTCGRYAAALTWFETLMGNAELVTFRPEGVGTAEAEMIKRTVKSVCKETRG